ncbi:MAG TPA: hypothetical protein VF331_18455 [Polyangiales bacterium]
MSQACARCGGQVTQGSAVCGRCGARLPAPAQNSAAGWGGLDIERNALPQSGATSNTLSGARAPASSRTTGTRRANPEASAASQRMPASPASPNSRSLATQRSSVTRASAPGNQAAASAAAAARVAAVVQSTPAAVPGVRTNADQALSGVNGYGDLENLTGFDGAPALDLVSVPPPRPASSPPAAQTPASLERSRADQARALAAYGDAPKKLYQTVPYFIRVLMRKRELDAELASITPMRKRLDGQAEDAMCALAELYYGQRTDPRLKPLAQQLRVVAESQSHVGAEEAAGARVAEQHKREIDRVLADIHKLERQAEPLRKREAEAQHRADTHKAQIRRNEALVRKAEAEIKALKTSTDVTAIDRITALEADRQAHHGEIQTLNVQLLPLQEDLGALRRELAKQLGTITALHEEQRKLSSVADRETQRHRLTTGGARTAHREALRSLATAALRAQLGGFFPEQAKVAVEAEQRAAKKREAEEVQRAAASAYDDAKYKQGMFILVGGTAFVFLVFAGLIVL